jgi:hypothetical protein
VDKQLLVSQEGLTSVELVTLCQEVEKFFFFCSVHIVHFVLEAADNCTWFSFLFPNFHIRKFLLGIFSRFVRSAAK